jgi:hypothetical protein
MLSQVSRLWGFGLLVAVLAGIAATQIAAAQSQSPMRCATTKDEFFTKIQCDIMDNNVKITDIVVNRGNCKSASQYAAELPPAPGPDATPIEKMLWSLAASSLPIGTYKFGDKINYEVLMCNVLEYTVKANGHSYTWTVR